MHYLSDEKSTKMHVRPRDENRTTLSLSKLRNIQKTNSRGNTNEIPVN